jgi:FMS-like tyrosine kinase 4
VKILLFLGRHLNVVNLLGIVHKPHKLMVIVEYCRYGNMKNFLLANRSQFQNLVDETSGELNSNGSEDLARTDLSNSSKDSGFCVRNPLNTIDLINFAFQISRGMQFIHSKRVRQAFFLHF